MFFRVHELIRDTFVFMCVCNTLCMMYCVLFRFSGLSCRLHATAGFVRETSVARGTVHVSSVVASHVAYMCVTFSACTGSRSLSFHCLLV